MFLSQISRENMETLERDGVFTNLGYLNTRSQEVFSFLGDAKYIDELLANPGISAIVTKQELVSMIPDRIGVMASPKPLETFLRIHHYLGEATEFYRKIEKIKIGSNCRIHPSAVIADMNVEIGNNVVIEPGVVINENSFIGNDVILRANAVIGTCGFEFKRIDGRVVPVGHFGGVSIRDRVELQAGTCVSRSVFRDLTTIGEDSKADNMVHIAHNVVIGKRCLMAANAMIAGSVTVGDDVWIGPGAQISSGVLVGEGASITIGAVVTRNVNAGERLSGNFAIDHSKYVAFIKTIR